MTDHLNSQVADLFNDHFNLTSSVSAAQTATAISKLAPQPSGDEKTLGDGFFWDLWRTIIEVAEQLDYDDPAQDKMVKVMRELTLLPDTGLTVWESRLWTDLPVLNAAFREHLDSPGRAESEEEQARAWVRFHAFSARLVGAGVGNDENLPIWMLREALEEEKNAPKSKALDRGLMTAAMYIEYAGPILVEALAVNPHPEITGQRRRLLRGGSLFTGEPGLQLDRWLFWTRRFREEAEKTSTEEAKEVALHAARLMEVWNETRLKTT
ncbi:hypothetical protein GGR54DRAFT_582832 [Hypoxylon sp. NC1633]|nr:hypothetical protein GGR54DRAFT_582832 [Hypoxylon sp. NC1633]